MLRTKQAAKLETHQRLINVPVIDQLNSGYPHNFLNVFTTPNPLASIQCMHQSHTVDIPVIPTEVLSYLMHSMQDLNETLVFSRREIPVLFCFRYCC